MMDNSHIGFMQGRLSPMMNGRIQSFPWDNWKNEFSVAEQNGFHLLEWTLDQERLYENPLLTSHGQKEIRELCLRHHMAIPSLTGDCFMQAPFWKAQGKERKSLQKDFLLIGEACVSVDISMIVVPLVDNGRIDDERQEDILVDFLQSQSNFFTDNNLQIVFESDFASADLVRFINRFEPSLFGINYDIGNSAALGYKPNEEIDGYGDRILNVHIKDRLLGGTTVPLGAGNADFLTVFSALSKIGYRGNYILQTARASDNDHAGVLGHYRDMTKKWLEMARG